MTQYKSLYDEPPDKWDLRFLDLARLVSTWSKDPSTKTGAVIVRPNKTVAGLGFNGFPRAMKDKTELYHDREEKLSRIIHCEINALIHTNEDVHNYTLYTFPFMCCDRCVVQMIQAGITRFVFPEAEPEKKERWSESFDKTMDYMYESGVEWTEIKGPDD